MRSLLFVFLIIVGVSAVKAINPNNSRPNIILVMTDDQGSNLSWMGHPILRTPNIDKFADQSLYFSQYFVSPTCAPTRSAIMSGRHEFKNGVTHTIYGRERMALSVTTLPQLLKMAGYKTAIFGKWHLGDEEAYLPGNRGFDEVLVHGAGGIGQQFEGGSSDFPPNQEPSRRYFDNVLLHNDKIVQTKGYCTDVFFGAALSWIKKQEAGGEPYFVYLSTNTPHAPLIAPKANMQRILDRNPGMDKVSGRLGMIENIDDNFGIFMQKLEEWGALENTLIIFTTDNGAPHKPGSNEFNAGYRTGKGTAYEGGVHVPAFWYWKGVIKPGTRCDALTAHVDLLPTFCELAGVKIPRGIQELDGMSLVPLLQNPERKWPERHLFTHTGRWGKGEKPNREKSWAIRTPDWRIVGTELYNMQTDPYEKIDVAAQHPGVVNSLTNEYSKWWQQVLPMMINENAPAEVDPLPKRYEQQKQTEGIPFWMPEITTLVNNE